jgi:hypothetical protein
LTVDFNSSGLTMVILLPSEGALVVGQNGDTIAPERPIAIPSNR